MTPATVLEDAAATTVDVLANDTDIDGGPKTIASATQPANGTVVVAGDGPGLTYKPDANYCNDGTPTDDFTYTPQRRLDGHRPGDRDLRQRRPGRGR